ncbi:MAG: regulatory protein RecX [Flavobacteriales bacterium]|nr:regulatory protein RecX [Flavobacteriales bacterium]
MKIYDLNTAREKIQAYCAYQERCHMEVAMKLKSWGLIQEAIDLLIVELIQFNFLNEERYARSFARGKFRIKKWGKIKIRMALKKRDINFKCIDLSMLEIDDKTYFNTLKELLQKKNETVKETNSYKRKMKLTSYLVSRGYEYDLINDALVELKLS